MLKTCVICGAEYKPKSSNQKMCGSEECKKKAHARRMKRYNASNKKAKVCEICGKEHFDGRRVCSDECDNVRKKRYNKERHDKAREKTKICIVCGKDHNNSSSVFCSDKCRDDRNVERAVKNKNKAMLKKIEVISDKAKEINELITTTIQSEYAKRISELAKVFKLDLSNHKTIDSFVSDKVNLNTPNVTSVRDGVCSLMVYQKVINKLDQIISLF